MDREQAVWYKIARKELELSHKEPLNKAEDDALRKIILEIPKDHYNKWGIRSIYFQFIAWQKSQLNLLLRSSQQKPSE